MYMSETHDGKLKSFGIRLAFLTVASCTKARQKQRAYQVEDDSERSSLNLDSYRPATIFPCLKVTASSKCEFKIGNLPLAGHPENHFQSKVKFVGFQNWPILTKRDKIESFGHPFHHSKFLNPTPLCKQFAIQTRKAFASSWSIRVDRTGRKKNQLAVGLSTLQRPVKAADCIGYFEARPMPVWTTAKPVCEPNTPSIPPHAAIFRTDSVQRSIL